MYGAEELSRTDASTVPYGFRAVLAARIGTRGWTTMKSGQKSPKAPTTRKEASQAGRIMTHPKEPGLDGRHRDRNPGEMVQLRKADQMLTRIERQGHALSKGADRLLRRIS